VYSAVMAERGTRPLPGQRPDEARGAAPCRDFHVQDLGRRRPRTQTPEGWVKRIERGDGKVWVPWNAANSLARLLSMRQLRSGGWSYFDSEQSSVEATSLAVMALSTESPDAARSGLDQLSHLQRRDGAWPAFGGDSDGSWTTALVLCALNGTGEFCERP
jgi:hypothetical protein